MKQLVWTSIYKGELKGSSRKRKQAQGYCYSYHRSQSNLCLKLWKSGHKDEGKRHVRSNSAQQNYSQMTLHSFSENLITAKVQLTSMYKCVYNAQQKPFGVPHMLHAVWLPTQ